MEPHTVLNPMATGAGIALIVPHLIEWLKKSPFFGWITPGTDMVSRLLSLAVALLASVGISYSYDAAAGQLIVNGLTFSAMLQLVFQVFAQYKGQEFVYRTAIKPYAK